MELGLLVAKMATNVPHKRVDKYDIMHHFDVLNKTQVGLSR